MAKNLQNEQLEEMGKRRRQGRIMKRVFIGAAVCVAFFAIYALVLPASTLEHPDPACGLEEHVHAEECFETQLTCELPETGAHVHIQACYDANDPERLICEEPATGHLHTQKCFATGDELVCENTEADHEHGEDCYLEPGTLVCEEEETVHVHNDACYEVAENLTCTNEDPEHVHGPECTESITTLTCTEESAGHVHHALCYDADGNLTCTEEEAVSVDHEHNDACNEQVPACGIEEHQHDEVCYDPETLQMIQATKDNKDAQDAENAEGTEGEDANESEEPEEAEPVDEDELAQLKEQGLAWENENMILTFSLPEETEGEVRFEVTEQPVDPSEISEEVKNDENAWQNNLQINATKDGEPIAEIASINAIATVEIKSESIEPILSEINFDEVAEEVKDEVGVEVVVKQKLNNKNDLPISERPKDITESITLTDSIPTPIAFSLASDEISTQASQVANPHFTVKYFANIDTIQEGGDNVLQVIDTQGENNTPVLPTNGAKNLRVKNLKLEKASSDNEWHIVSEPKQTEVYRSKNCEYIQQPGLIYFNALRDNPGYWLCQVVVRYPDGAELEFQGDPVSETPPIVNFTNRQAAIDENHPYVLLKEGTEIKLIYECKSTTHTFSEVLMHDYDISDGKLYKSNAVNDETYDNQDDASLTYYANTQREGINSDSNYESSSDAAKYAFGNNNAGTTLGTVKTKDDVEINKANASGFGNCSFGIVKTELDEKGSIQFADGIIAPKIFGNTVDPKTNTETVVGKTTYDGYGLTFTKVGDTYTIESVQSGNETVLSDLSTFKSRPNWNNTKLLYSNEFWALDSAPSFGAEGHDLKFGSKPLVGNRRYIGDPAKGNTLPTHDYDIDRNSYFGMEYTVQFDLIDEYCGPLEYYFFGDDDMWVFLDGKLICDIGGVHGSVGEYVNLWNYINNSSSRNGTRHTLKFFYTERGASGSTCYMRFTLPSVIGTEIQDTGSLRIDKKLSGNAFKQDANGQYSEEFNFKISLEKDGKSLDHDYAYTKYRLNADGSSTAVARDLVLWDEAEFALKGNEYIVIEHLPIGTHYRIEEEVLSGQEPSVKVDGIVQEESYAEGAVTTVDNSQVVFTNIRYSLPETGGIGGEQMVLIGGVLVIFAASLTVRRFRAKEKIC